MLLYCWAGLLGVGFGTVLPTTSGVLAENYDEKERGSLMGIQSVFTNIGAMYLTYVGGWVAAIPLETELPGISICFDSSHFWNYISSK